MRYQLVFEGRLVTGYDPEMVKENLAALFGTSVAAVEPLFSNPPTIVKKELDRRTASRYQAAFEKTGALCEVVPMDEEGAPGVAMAPAPLPVEAPTVTRVVPLAPPPSAQATSRSPWSVALPLLVLLLACAYLSFRTLPIRHGPGAIAPDEPRQVNLEDRRAFTHEDFKITPLARFSLEARVLATERYRFDREAAISPWDFALGWGPMSDERVLDELKIRQGARFFTWSSRKMPIPRREIETHAANMHLIPSTKEIARAMARARTGNLVSIDGYLVKVESADRWHWKSSMGRADTGAGACELIWVETLELY